MPYQDIVIQTAGNYRKAFERDPVTQILDKLGLGDKYRDASAKTMLEDPYTEIEDGFITTVGNHASFRESLVKDTKDIYCMVKDGVCYTLKNPVDIALLPVQTIYEMIKRPKVLATAILGIAVLGAGCISQPSNSSSNDADLPIKTPTPETQIYTTPDGLTFVGPYGHDECDGMYLPSYDTDGDGDIDAKDSAVGPNDAARHNNNIAIAIRATFGIPTTSKLHQDYPDIEEFRIRHWDLNNDGNHDKIDILINHKVIYTTTTDTNQDGSINLNDVLTELGWW